jgi:hypothetical protein
VMAGIGASYRVRVAGRPVRAQELIGAASVVERVSNHP